MFSEHMVVDNATVRIYSNNSLDRSLWFSFKIDASSVYIRAYSIPPRMFSNSGFYWMCRANSFSTTLCSELIGWEQTESILGGV